MNAQDVQEAGLLWCTRSAKRSGSETISHMAVLGILTIVCELGRSFSLRMDVFYTLGSYGVLLEKWLLRFSKVSA